MGGCYEDKYSSRSYAPPAGHILHLQEFYAHADRSSLFAAYRSYAQRSTAGFIQEIVNLGKTRITKEFPEYELESKLELWLDGTAGKRYSLKDIMDTFEFSPAPSARFVKDASNKESSGINYFFGTPEGEESFVLISKGGKWYLKEKGPRQKFDFGFPGEEYVFKRAETRKETNPLEVAQAILKQYTDGKTNFIGGVSKDRVEAHLLQTITGRIYSLTVDYIAREASALPGMLQFEVEYAGRIERYPGMQPEAEEHTEKIIVDDILNVLKQIIFLHHGAQLPQGQRLQIAPSQLRKFDFVQQRGEKVLVPVRSARSRRK
ncbi:TPA: hypothetical protein HA242_03520 [Candidatus Woesearchaeota archaeon]|nr:hypothetical protein [Candidatus Woesearchaeota archaeon]